MDGTYLDYASTAAIRPREVADAVHDFLLNNGTTPGRAGHRLAVAADRIALQTRQALADLLQIQGDPGRITFFPNATYALNAALYGLVGERDKVVVTCFDHNAVLRPSHILAQQRNADVVLVSGHVDGTLDMDMFANAVRGARVVVLNAVSNVLGTALDLKALTRIAHANDAVVVVDAAQAAGETDFNVRDTSADVVAFTGHKALLGPPGTGGLWVRDGIEMGSFITGGTGGDSLERDMPAAYPDRMEAGSLNGSALAGLLASVTWLNGHDHVSMQRAALARGLAMRNAFSGMKNVTVHSPQTIAAPIVTITARTIDPASLASRLDREYGIMVRAGHHCAPEVHRLIGTGQTGAVRFSAGWATTDDDVERAIQAVAALTGS
jgi:selenocysteine lyase/cysteine desulfurase